MRSVACFGVLILVFCWLCCGLRLGCRLASQGGLQTLQLRFAQGIRNAESSVSHRLAFSTAASSGPCAIERGPTDLSTGETQGTNSNRTGSINTSGQHPRTKGQKLPAGIRPAKTSQRQPAKTIESSAATKAVGRSDLASSNWPQPSKRGQFRGFH